MLRNARRRALGAGLTSVLVLAGALTGQSPASAAEPDPGVAKVVSLIGAGRSLHPRCLDEGPRRHRRLRQAAALRRGEPRRACRSRRRHRDGRRAGARGHDDVVGARDLGGERAPVWRSQRHPRHRRGGPRRRQAGPRQPRRDPHRGPAGPRHQLGVAQGRALLAEGRHGHGGGDHLALGRLDGDRVRPRLSRRRLRSCPAGRRRRHCPALGRRPRRRRHPRRHAREQRLPGEVAHRRARQRPQQRRGPRVRRRRRR